MQAPANGGDEAATFLAAHPATTAVELLFPDLNGILRGKRLRRRELAGFYSAGQSCPATMVLLDSRGGLIDGIAQGSADGDPDVWSRPVPGTLAPVPWATGALGQCLATLVQRDGTPYFADPRAVLARVLARFGELGLTPVVAVEFEFYLLEDSAQPPRNRRGRVPGTARRAAGPQVYSLEDLHALEPFFADVAAAGEAQGLPIGTVVSEYGAGQFEVNLGHVADALLAADHAVLLRRLIRGVAARHGLAATFMAKPFAELDGSGMHVHLSLLDADGRNVFSPAADMPLPRQFRHAIGGVLAALPESLAIFAPNANSYRRFRTGCFAPVAPDWGSNNRQVAVRLPPADAANQRLEHRVAGADCNPYLALAAILAAVHAGLRAGREPPPPVPEGEAAPVSTTPFPRWEQALAAFASGRALPAYLGADFCALFAAARRFEADAFHAEVPDLDYAWYLPTI
jgi:glutamine synthetase